MGNVEKVAQNVQNLPAMQQQAMQQQAAETLRDQKAQISKAEQGSKQRGAKARTGPHSGPKFGWYVHEQTEENEERPGHDAWQSSREREPETEPEHDESLDNSANVWAGNILNMKI